MGNKKSYDENLGCLWERFCLLFLRACVCFFFLHKHKNCFTWTQIRFAQLRLFTCTSVGVCVCVQPKRRRKMRKRRQKLDDAVVHWLWWWARRYWHAFVFRASTRTVFSACRKWVFSHLLYRSSRFYYEPSLVLPSHLPHTHISLFLCVFRSNFFPTCTRIWLNFFFWFGLFCMNSPSSRQFSSSEKRSVWARSEVQWWKIWQIPKAKCASRYGVRC